MKRKDEIEGCGEIFDDGIIHIMSSLAHKDLNWIVEIVQHRETGQGALKVMCAETEETVIIRDLIEARVEMSALMVNASEPDDVDPIIIDTFKACIERAWEHFGGIKGMECALIEQIAKAQASKDVYGS